MLKCKVIRVKDLMHERGVALGVGVRLGQLGRGGALGLGVRARTVGKGCNFR